MDLGRQGAFKYKPRASKLELGDTINGKPILDYIAELASYRHTQEEAAGLIGCSPRTFKKFLADHEEASHAWKDGKRLFKASLRRLGMLHARSDPSTWRFLAKNHLDMTDGGHADQKAAAEALGEGEPSSKAKLIERIVSIQRLTILETTTNTAKAPTGRSVVKRE